MIALRGRSGTRVLPAAATLAAVGSALAFAGCGGGGERPARLVDGSEAKALPEALDRLGRRTVTARVRVIRAAKLDIRGRSCLDSFRSEFQIAPATVVVQRIGVITASLTFLDAERRVVLGCDRTARTAASGAWCARSVGRLFSGRLRDARVDILCRDARGDPVGFGWIEPAAGVRWVVVHNASSTEVEEVAAKLPVRIATSDVDPATSSATFDVQEYDADGKEVRRYRLRAGVAG